jgi:hypothetical protein
MAIQRRRDPATYHNPRDSIESDRRTKRLRKRSGIVTPGFYVPAFGVRRPVEKTEQLDKFLKDLKSELPRNYRIRPLGSLAMTLSEQKPIIDHFHAIDIQPERDEVRRIAHSMQPELKQSLKGVPRRLVVPIGGINSFGAKGAPNKVGLLPGGWKGFGKNYSERNPSQRGTPQEILPLPVIVREVNIIAGATLNGFSHHEGFDLRNSRVNPMNRTPHITIAEKKSGGSISQSEMAGLEGVIRDIMFEDMSITLSDPVTYVNLGREAHYIDPDTQFVEQLHYEEYPRAPRRQ